MTAYRTELRPVANEPDVDGEPGELTLLREQLIVGAGITSIPPPEPLITGLLDLDSVAVFYGRPGCGKSFAAIDVAASVASRVSWQHRPTTHGGVLYIAAEGVGGLGVRVRAWQEYHAINARTNGGDSTDTDIDRLTWLPRPVNLLEPRWLDGLIALVAELRPVLVVIDTVARSMIGGDENTSKDMGKVVEAGDRIRRAAGSCVLFVHHSGKDEGRGMRGSNSLEGGCDTAWEITREVQWVTLNCQRQKNHATDEKPITLGMGNIAGSVVLVPDTRRAIDTMHDNLKTTLVALDQSRQVPGPALLCGSSRRSWPRRRSTTTARSSSSWPSSSTSGPTSNPSTSSPRKDAHASLLPSLPSNCHHPPWQQG
jgi:hypothetical protein